MENLEKNKLYEEVISFIENCNDVKKLRNMLIETIDNNATVNIEEIKRNHINNFFELFKQGKKIKFRDMPNIYVKEIILNPEKEAGQYSKIVAIDNNGHKSTHSFSGEVYSFTTSSFDLILD